MARRTKDAVLFRNGSRYRSTSWAHSTPADMLAANTARSFPVINVNSCGVPSTAKAAVFNVTAVAPGDNGNFIIYPAGTARPNTSVVNWSVADFATGNGAFLPLANQGGVDITVYPNMPPGTAGTVHLVIDVTGYFQ